MLRKVLKYLLLFVVALVVVVGLGYLLGVFGVPTVESVENRFGEVNETTTTIETDLTIDNPNPIDITIGGLTIDYDIEMNDINMATGTREGLSLDRGESTIELTTYLYNERIPDWWASHIEADERTELVIHADVSHGLLGSRSHEIESDREIETDILAGFNSTEPRPIDAEQPLVNDPVLYLNETEGWFGEDVTDERTPLEKQFTFYNPKPWPYTLTEIGYTVQMNDITVGEGETERATVIPGGTSETIAAETEIRNDRLDEWWVTHLEHDEVTELHVDFYVIVDPDPTGVTDLEPIRIDVDELDHETTIETDIFGTKDDPGGQDGAGDNGTDQRDDGGDADETDDTVSDDQDEEGTNGGDEEDGDADDDDGGLLDGGDESDDDGLLP